MGLSAGPRTAKRTTEVGGGRWGKMERDLQNLRVLDG